MVSNEVSISVGTPAAGKKSVHLHLRVWVLHRGSFYLGLCSFGELSDLQRPSIHIPRRAEVQASFSIEDFTLTIIVTIKLLQIANNLNSRHITVECFINEM